MKYKVYDKETDEDVTGKAPWIITPEGRLGYILFDTLRDDLNEVRCKVCHDRRFRYEVVKDD